MPRYWSVILAYIEFLGILSCSLCVFSTLGALQSLCVSLHFASTVHIFVFIPSFSLFIFCCGEDPLSLSCRGWCHFHCMVTMCGEPLWSAFNGLFSKILTIKIRFLGRALIVWVVLGLCLSNLYMFHAMLFMHACRFSSLYPMRGWCMHLQLLSVCCWRTHVTSIMGNVGCLCLSCGPSLVSWCFVLLKPLPRAMALQLPTCVFWHGLYLCLLPWTVTHVCAH